MASTVDRTGITVLYEPEAKEPNAEYESSTTLSITSEAPARFWLIQSSLQHRFCSWPVRTPQEDVDMRNGPTWQRDPVGRLRGRRRREAAEEEDQPDSQVVEGSVLASRSFAQGYAPSPDIDLGL
jgi:hypothetical protein